MAGMFHRRELQDGHSLSCDPRNLYLFDLFTTLLIFTFLIFLRLSKSLPFRSFYDPLNLYLFDLFTTLVIFIFSIFLRPS